MVTKTRDKDEDKNHDNKVDRNDLINYENFDIKMKFKISFYLYHRANFIYIMELGYSRCKAVQLTKMFEKAKVNMKPEDLKTEDKIENAMLDILGMSKEEIDKIPYKGLSDEDLEKIKKIGKEEGWPWNW